MRLTSFGIVLVLVTSFWANQGNAQIPERVLFQPGSYAFGPYHSTPSAGIAQQPVALPTDSAAVNSAVVESATAEKSPETENNSEENKTEWETTFGVEESQQENETDFIESGLSISSNPTTVPYLAYHRNPITHRIHVVPYQPGYAAEPETFPKHQSKLNLLLSSLPSREQNRPQIQYASYYDPDPVIVTDKPSRLQLILGYPNASWTSCCENRWGVRLAQCPGVQPVALGPYAEAGIKDQEPIVSGHSGGLFGGIFSGQRPLNYAQAIPLPPHQSLKQVPSAYYPVYSREELQRIAEQRDSYIGKTVVPVPKSIPKLPSANREIPLPPKTIKTIKTTQPLSSCADNQPREECKKHINSCHSTSCKSCATKTAHRSLKNNKNTCGTENKEK
ncbi:MAG: hypothetical protein LBP87_02240 [Planctomycetaceae bacterium]|jgi:hypothetical protein|nr:hypothetical protein [Planctomycetaceae bacterium]